MLQPPATARANGDANPASAYPHSGSLRHVAARADVEPKGGEYPNPKQDCSANVYNQPHLHTDIPLHPGSHTHAASPGNHPR